MNPYINLLIDNSSSEEILDLGLRIMVSTYQAGLDRDKTLKTAELTAVQDKVKYKVVITAEPVK